MVLQHKILSTVTTDFLRLCLCKLYQAVPLEAISQDYWLHTDIDHDNNGQMTSLNYIIMHSLASTSLEKTAYAFHFFDAFYALRSSSNA